MKKPWVGALLNLIPLGIGYQYLGRNKRALVTLIVGVLAGIAGLMSVAGYSINEGLGGRETSGVKLLLFLLSPVVVVAAFTSVDAWLLAQGKSRAVKVWLLGSPLGLGIALVGMGLARGSIGLAVLGLVVFSALGIGVIVLAWPTNPIRDRTLSERPPS